MSSEEYLRKLYRPPLDRGSRAKYICLDKNEPPYSAFDSLAACLTDDDMQSLRTYPDLYDLYIELAQFADVSIENLLLSQGSEQALRTIFDIFLSPGDEVVFARPCFAMYDVFAYMNKASVREIRLENKLRVSVPDILTSVSNATRMFVVANPHNFTGSAYTLDEIVVLARHTARTDTILVVDEAYFHYYSIDTVSLIHEYPHLIITRTFSKAFGLAGCRIGYAIANVETIDLLRRIKPIDEIGCLASILARKAIADNDAIISRNVKHVRKWQGIFGSSDLPDAEYIVTQANYILIRSKCYGHHVERLKAIGILPRKDFKEACLENCIRFSVLDDTTMQTILDIFTTSASSETRVS